MFCCETERASWPAGWRMPSSWNEMGRACLIWLSSLSRRAWRSWRSGWTLKAPGFGFQVKTADGGQVLATNLKEGETLSATVSSVWYSTFVVGEHFTQEEYDLYNSENVMYSQSACRDRERAGAG